MVLVCHVISQNLEPMKVIYYPAKFVDHRDSACRDMFLICRMTLQDHVIKTFNYFRVRSPSR